MIHKLRVYWCTLGKEWTGGFELQSYKVHICLQLTRVGLQPMLHVQTQCLFSLYHAYSICTQSYLLFVAFMLFRKTISFIYITAA